MTTASTGWELRRGRRAASLLALVLAGSASLATSQVAPTPPTATGSANGSLALTSDAPVAVLAFDVVVELGDAVDPRVAPVLHLVSTVQGRNPDAVGAPVGSVDSAVEPAVALRERTPSLRLLEDGPDSGAREWELPCREGRCSVPFRLVLDWRDPLPDRTIDVEWRLRANVALHSEEAAAATSVTLTAPRPAPEEAASTAIDGAAAVRLDPDHPLRLWRVTVSRPAASDVDSHLAAVARLSPVVAQPGEAGVPRAEVALLIDEGDPSGAALAEVADDVSFAFDPFAGCRLTEACEETFTVGLQLTDRQPGAAAAVAWQLKAWLLAAAGAAPAIAVDVEAVPEMAIVKGTLRGTTRLSEGTTNESIRFDVDLVEGDTALPWAGLRRPVRATLVAVATSTGHELPAGSRLTIGSSNESAVATLGQAAFVAFDPNSSGRCRVLECDLSDVLRFSADFLSGQAGSELTIDWELEIAVGLTDPSGRVEISLVP